MVHLAFWQQILIFMSFNLESFSDNMKHLSSIRGFLWSSITIKYDYICFVHDSQLIKRSFLFWNFLDYRHTRGIYNEHVNSRADISADLCEIVFKLGMCHVFRNKQGQRWATVLLVTFHYVHTNSDRIKIMFRLLFYFYCSIRQCYLHIFLVRKEWNFGSATECDLQLGPISLIKQMIIISQAQIFEQFHEFPIVKHFAPSLRVSVIECHLYL